MENEENEHFSGSTLSIQISSEIPSLESIISLIPNLNKANRNVQNLVISSILFFLRPYCNVLCSYCYASSVLALKKEHLPTLCCKEIPILETLNQIFKPLHQFLLYL